MAYFSIHNHSSYSNAKAGLDSINRVEEMIEYAHDIGLKGVVLSEHELLSSHVKMIKHYKKLKEQGKLRDDFVVGAGNEIYLCHQETLEELKEARANKDPDAQFYHFLLLAVNREGYQSLRKLSSQAWIDSWRDGLVTRTPSFKSNLKKYIKKGDVIASTACIGGLVGQSIIKMRKAQQEGNQAEVERYKKMLFDFLDFCIDVFGKENFYLELQPSEHEEQNFVNRQLINLSKQTGLKYVIATDGHYLKKEDRLYHKRYLLSQNIEREVDDFYDATFIMSEDEIWEYMSPHLTEGEIQTGLDNTIDIYNKIEFFDLYHDTIVPTPPIPEFKFEHLEQGYKQYEYIYKFAHSEHEIDRYYLHLIQEGLIEKIVNKGTTKEYFHRCLDRINTELKEVWLISERLHERVSGYYVLVRDVILNCMWEGGDSIVGVARGSAGGFLTVYLLDISQMNPLTYDLPHFRHLTAERPELPDCDIDSEQSKRKHILEAMRHRYGEDKTISISTFSTEGSRSALLSAARGMGIDISEINYLTSLIPVERGFTWTLEKAFGLQEGERGVKELINAVSKWEGLQETALRIEGLIKGVSVHASGIYVYQTPYTDHNSAMRVSSGQLVTQLDMGDSDYCGGLKIDCLTVQGIDRIRKALDLLIDNGLLEDKGSLKANYDAYLHPDVLVYDDQEMWKKVAKVEIPDLFQMETSVGSQCAKKAKPRNVVELAAINSLMRLMAEGEEQPIDKYVRHKNNIEEWHSEMRAYDLTDDEIEIMKDHAGETYGLTPEQEGLMMYFLDERICGVGVKDSNYARKVVGKKLMQEIPKVKDMFFSNGPGSTNIKNYIWDTQIAPQMLYSFSRLHSQAYSLIALQEMNLAHFYPRVFWDTACLTVSAGADQENENNKGTDYGRIGAAIARLQNHGVEVSPPDINKSAFGFIPDWENNRIIYSLKAVNSMNDDVVHEIINNRPYVSFQDFYERMFVTKKITRSQMLNLVKAGCFNEFDAQVEIMKQFVAGEVDVKESLNGQNMKRVIALGLLDGKELVQYKDYFNFREYLKKLPVARKTARPKNRFFLLEDVYSKSFFENTFSEDAIDEVLANGSLVIDEKAFEKEYKKLMIPMNEILSDEEFVRKFNQAQLIEKWNDIARGSVSSWAMESMCFYPKDVGHELQHVGEMRYGISRYSELPPEPEVIDTFFWKGKERPNYRLVNLVGTVLDKDKNKHTFTLLTHDGEVIYCKTHSGGYAHYDKEIKKDGKRVEESWLKRNTKLMVSGYKSSDRFILKAEKGNHTITLITDIKEDGSLSLQSERTRV